MPADLRERRFGDVGRSLSEAGETELLASLVAMSRPGPRDAGRGEVLVAAGDDAAVWQPPRGASVVVTQDAVVEDVDYRPRWTTPYAVGRRALTLSLSDLAGMGAAPAWCVVTLCAAAGARFEDLLAIQQGVCDLAAEVGCAVIGGDVSRTSGPLVVDVVAGGVADAGRLLRRDAGRAGDHLAVTGSLGRAAAGLRLLAGDGPPLPSGDREDWIAAQLHPVARLAEGMALAQAGVRCAGDISDGLLVDAARTADACGCAAELWVDSLPAAPSLRAAYPGDWLALAVAGGEDFELLLAAPAPTVAELERTWSAGLAPLTTVGRLVPGSGLRLLDRRGGAEVPAPASAFRHF